jgi:hypothetical protein
MTSLRKLAISIWGYESSAPLPYSQDLSMYREFRFGADLLAVAKRAHVKPSAARMIHERPAVIQELEWQVPYMRSSPRADSVKDILFSFYNGGLFRIVVTYDPERIAGMTAEDIVEAVSAQYGTATSPVAEIILSSTQLYNNGGEKVISDRNEKIIACWEDSQHSFNLFLPSHQSTFGMVMYSKRLDALARTAIVESVRLDKQEAPRREIECQKKKDEERRGWQEKARQSNKASFRP